MAFEKFIKTKRHYRTNHTWLTDLEVGESWFAEGQSYADLRGRIYHTERRLKRKYAYHECKNGTVIRRDA